MTQLLQARQNKLTIKNNIAYIDGANLNNAMKEFGWDLDYKKSILKIEK